MCLKWNHVLFVAQRASDYLQWHWHLKRKKKINNLFFHWCVFSLESPLPITHLAHHSGFFRRSHSNTPSWHTMVEMLHEHWHTSISDCNTCTAQTSKALGLTGDIHVGAGVRGWKKQVIVFSCFFLFPQVQYLMCRDSKLELQFISWCIKCSKIQVPSLEICYISSKITLIVTLVNFRHKHVPIYLKLYPHLIPIFMLNFFWTVILCEVFSLREIYQP